MRHALTVAWIALGAAAAVGAQAPQAPWRGENLQYFPKDITRPQLVQRMREFSFALDVRCQYCHAGGDGISFDGVVFASDEKPAKVKAREMLRMVDQINGAMLARLPSRVEPRVTVDCATCHRGSALPKSLQTTLFEIVEKDGAAAAVARYRALRQNTMVAGKYNFGEWEINELARRLTEAGNTAAAITILDMNGEFYPKSADIDFTIAELHRRRGETDRAVRRYRTALEKNPKHQGARRSLTELTMQAWSKSLGVECTHCHVDGKWADTSKPTFEFAQRMNRMLAALNAGPLKDVAEISCWTCHRGRSVPARLPRESWENIRDHHQPELASRPTHAVYPASLGVDCAHCHEADRTLNTKAPKAMVAKMMPIFEEIPRHFDKAVRSPVTQCYMCHQGRIKPER